MYDMNAYAVRKDGVIQVALSGKLANSCWTAAVKDKYPGGNIVYVVDPGTAQVFVEETMKPGSEICLMMLVPWVAQVSIPSATHSQVTVYVNGDAKLKVDVKDEPSQYRVIALTSSPAGSPTGCSVIPADAPYLAIYSSVFGPASKADCENWRQQNCVSQ
jgi:hypothetical protein